jgi:hypothetical protein
MGGGELQLLVLYLRKLIICVMYKNPTFFHSLLGCGGGFFLVFALPLNLPIGQPCCRFVDTKELKKKMCEELQYGRLGVGKKSTLDEYPSLTYYLLNHCDHS